jgi:hypothetical protein
MNARGRLRRVRRATGCAAAVAVPLLCLPSPAAARPGDEVRPRSLHLTTSAVATRGYAVTVETVGHHRVILTVRKKRQLATYMVKGRVSRHRIKADFGRFGRVSLRFHGRPRPFEVLPGSRLRPSRQRLRCRGRRPEREVGRFRGTIEFDGQRGFTRLAVGRLHGEVRRSYRQVCRRVRGRRPNLPRAAISAAADANPFGFTLSLLTARSRVGSSLTRFTVIELEPPQGIPVPRSDLFSIVSASLQERVGRVRILRSTFQMAAPGTVRISRRGTRPATARLALDSPFSGRALYRGPTDGSPASWSGSLAVRLLGTGALPLTGGRFKATLCRVSAFRPGSSCFRRADARAAKAAAPTPSLWPRPGSPR